MRNMYFIYNILVLFIGFLLKPIAFFNKKLHFFLNGRKQTFKKLQYIKKTDKVIWIHVASLGEFEQGRPIIEAIKKDADFKNYKIVLTFFSPSGYEVRKNYNLTDVVVYLPLDTKKNAKKFLDTIHPEIAIFIKYEFWPNLLRELKKRKIPTIVVSAIFRENQAFFKSSFIGKFMRNSLHTISHFFVQNEASKNLLNSIGFTNVTICSDTRFDRVYSVVNQDNDIDKITPFLQDKPNDVLVAGSTWQKDEKILVNYINNHATDDEKFIIAPHTMDKNKLNELHKNIIKKVQFYSDDNIHSNTQVLILDTIGILSKVYSYATIAYVGGGFGVGIHNILEPATFGVPVIIGPNYQKFQEAKDLIKKQGCFVVHDKEELVSLMKQFKNKTFKINAGNNSSKYVKNNLGGTDCVLNYLKKKLLLQI